MSDKIKSANDCIIIPGKFCQAGKSREKLDCVICILRDIEKHMYEMKSKKTQERAKK